MANFTTKDAEEWKKSIVAQVDALTKLLAAVDNKISTGDNGESIVKIVDSKNDHKLSEEWADFALCIQAANQRITDQNNLFISSIDTFIARIDTTVQTSTEQVDELQESIDDKAKRIDELKNTK